VLGGSLLTGLTATVLVQGWLEVVGGDWGANVAVLSLMVLAVWALAGLALLAVAAMRARRPALAA